jgi:hypothetical protein
MKMKLIEFGKIVDITEVHNLKVKMIWIPYGSPILMNVPFSNCKFLKCCLHVYLAPVPTSSTT